jgi:hypothetical protein
LADARTLGGTPPGGAVVFYTGQKVRFSPEFRLKCEWSERVEWFEGLADGRLSATSRSNLSL